MHVRGEGFKKYNACYEAIIVVVFERYHCFTGFYLFFFFFTLRVSYRLYIRITCAGTLLRPVRIAPLLVIVLKFVQRTSVCKRKRCKRLKDKLNSNDMQRCFFNFSIDTRVISLTLVGSIRSKIEKSVFEYDFYVRSIANELLQYIESTQAAQ